MSLVLQPSCRVRDEYINISSSRRLDRIKQHRGAVGTRVLGHYRHLISISPGLQLLHRGSAKGITGSQHDLLTLSFETPGQFANGCRLAGTVYPHHQNNEGLGNLNS